MNITNLEDGKTIEKQYFSDNRLWYIWHKKNGKIHRDNDEPAYIEYSYTHNKIFTKIWYENGKRHREGLKPSYVRYYTNGSICKEKYIIKGIEYTFEEIQVMKRKLIVKTILNDHK